jgi:hypothetical protein
MRHKALLPAPAVPLLLGTSHVVLQWMLLTRFPKPINEYARIVRQQLLLLTAAHSAQQHRHTVSARCCHLQL